MDDSNTTNSLSDFGLIYNKNYCRDNSENNTEVCENFQTIIFIMTANYYTNKVFYPLTAFLVLIGTILNLYCLYYFFKITRRNSQNIYLSTISISDTIDLHINFTLPILRQSAIFDDYFRNSIRLCRFTGVLTEFFLIFSTWMIMLLIIERLIYISRPVKSPSSHAQKRAKISILILAIIVALLSLYRLFDLNGIDQISVFSVLVCSGSHKSLTIIRNFNLMIWITIPNLFTLIMCLMMIHSIQSAAEKSRINHLKIRRFKYNRTTRIVLFISILTLILHTPIGIVNALDVIYGHNEGILIFLTIFLLRKLTLILYQISLCCKFFIYNQIFRDFKRILKMSMSRLTHRTNSAELGRPFREYLPDCPSNRRISFGPPRRLTAYPGNQRDSLTKNIQKHSNNLNERQQRRSSTRTNRGYRPINCSFD